MKTKKIICLFCALFTLNKAAIQTFAASGSVNLVESYNGSSASASINYDDSIFGSASYYNDGNSETVSKITENNYSNSYINLTKYRYITYKYDRILNARVQRLFSEYYYVAQGNTRHVTTTLSSTVSNTYSESFSNSVSNTITAKAVASSGATPLDKVSIEASTSSTNTITNTISNSYSYSYSSGYTDSIDLKAENGDVSYSWEVRSNFNVYVSYLYEVNYNCTKTKQKTWYGKTYYTYSYTIASLDIVGTMYHYEAVYDTGEVGFYPYTNNGYNYLFAGEKNTNLTYID